MNSFLNLLQGMGGMQALPMNPMYPNPLMLGYIPPAQNHMIGFPAANITPQQPEIIPFIAPNQKGDLT